MVLSWGTATDWDSASDTRIEHAAERNGGAIRLGRDNTEQSPLAFYRFHEGAGSTLGDVSGNGNHGTINGPTWTTAPSRFAGALSLDGVDDSIDLGSVYGNANIYEFETWFYPTATGWQNLLDQRYVWAIIFDRAGNNDINIGTYGSNSFTGASLALDAWHHVYAWYLPGTEVGASINGGSFVSSTTEDGISQYDQTTIIGGPRPGESNNYELSGRLTETRLFNGNSRSITDPSDSLYITDGTLTTGWQS